MTRSRWSNRVCLIINHTTWTQIAMGWNHDLRDSLNSSPAYKEPYRCIYGYWINGNRSFIEIWPNGNYVIYLNHPNLPQNILYHVGESIRLQRPWIRNILQTLTFIFIHKMHVQGIDGKCVCGSTSMRSIIWRVDRITAHIFVFIIRVVQTKYNQTPFRTSIAISSIGGLTKDHKSDSFRWGRSSRNWAVIPQQWLVPVWQRATKWTRTLDLVLLVSIYLSLTN